MNTDPIADLLTRIRNASLVGHPTVSVPASKKKEQILAVLKDEGYIRAYQVSEEEKGKPNILITLAYSKDGESAIKKIDRLSRPGIRKYIACEDIPRYRGGLGTVIVSTSTGMMSGEQAREKGIGGELICSVF
jgi:small subunit ribosomal protein S8